MEPSSIIHKPVPFLPCLMHYKCTRMKTIGHPTKGSSILVRRLMTGAGDAFLGEPRFQAFLCLDPGISPCGKFIHGSVCPHSYRGEGRNQAVVYSPWQASFVPYGPTP